MKTTTSISTWFLKGQKSFQSNLKSCNPLSVPPRGTRMHYYLKWKAVVVFLKDKILYSNSKITSYPPAEPAHQGMMTPLVGCWPAMWPQWSLPYDIQWALCKTAPVPNLKWIERLICITTLLFPDVLSFIKTFTHHADFQKWFRSVARQSRAVELLELEHRKTRFISGVVDFNLFPQDNLQSTR